MIMLLNIFLIVIDVKKNPPDPNHEEQIEQNPTATMQDDHSVKLGNYIFDRGDDFLKILGMNIKNNQVSLHTNVTHGEKKLETGQTATDFVSIFSSAEKEKGHKKILSVEQQNESDKYTFENSRLKNVIDCVCKESEEKEIDITVVDIIDEPESHINSTAHDSDFNYQDSNRKNEDSGILLTIQDMLKKKSNIEEKQSTLRNQIGMENERSKQNDTLNEDNPQNQEGLKNNSVSFSVDQDLSRSEAPTYTVRRRRLLDDLKLKHSILNNSFNESIKQYKPRRRTLLDDLKRKKKLYPSEGVNMEPKLNLFNVLKYKSSENDDYCFNAYYFDVCKNDSLPGQHEENKESRVGFTHAIQSEISAENSVDRSSDENSRPIRDCKIDDLERNISTVNKIVQYHDDVLECKMIDTVDKYSQNETLINVNDTVSKCVNFDDSKNMDQKCLKDKGNDKLVKHNIDSVVATTSESENMCELNSLEENIKKGNVESEMNLNQDSNILDCKIASRKIGGNDNCKSLENKGRGADLGSVSLQSSEEEGQRQNEDTSLDKNRQVNENDDKMKSLKLILRVSRGKGERKKFKIVKGHDKRGKGKKRRRSLQKSAVDFKKHIDNIKLLLRWSNATPIKGCTNGNYECAFCEAQFNNPCDLKSHTMLQHHGCKESHLVKKKYDLYDFYIKMDITELQCRICFERRENVREMIDHFHFDHGKKTHRDIKNHIVPFKFDKDNDKLRCCVCYATYAKFKILLEHVVSSHFRNYICDTCDKGCVNKEKLVKHIEIHRAIAISCPFCDKAFKTVAEKSAHEQTHVYRTPDGGWSCVCCQAKFEDRFAKQRHMESAHSATLPELARDARFNFDDASPLQ